VVCIVGQWPVASGSGLTERAARAACGSLRGCAIVYVVVAMSGLTAECLHAAHSGEAAAG
jgi:hypothetical protein